MTPPEPSQPNQATEPKEGYSPKPSPKADPLCDDDSEGGSPSSSESRSPSPSPMPVPKTAAAAKDSTGVQKKGIISFD